MHENAEYKKSVKSISSGEEYEYQIKCKYNAGMRSVNISCEDKITMESYKKEYLEEDIKRLCASSMIILSPYELYQTIILCIENGDISLDKFVDNVMRLICKFCMNLKDKISLSKMIDIRMDKEEQNEFERTTKMLKNFDTRYYKMTKEFNKLASQLDLKIEEIRKITESLNVTIQKNEQILKEMPHSKTQ